VVNPAGTVAYVANQRTGTVSVIDTATNTVTGTIPVGSNPYGVAVNPSATMVYAVNNTGGSLSEIETATNTVAATIPVGTGPHDVALSPDGTVAYVTNGGSNTVSVLSLIIPGTPAHRARWPAPAGHSNGHRDGEPPTTGGPGFVPGDRHRHTTAANGSQTCTVTGASGSCTVSGLTNGDTYTFSSTATDAGGTSGPQALGPGDPSGNHPGTPGAPSAVPAPARPP